MQYFVFSLSKETPSNQPTTQPDENIDLPNVYTAENTSSAELTTENPSIEESSQSAVSSSYFGESMDPAKDLPPDEDGMEGDLVKDGKVEVDLHGKVEADLPEDQDLTEGISPSGDLMEVLPQDEQLVEDQVPDEELAGTITLEELSSNNGKFNIFLTFQD